MTRRTQHFFISVLLLALLAVLPLDAASNGNTGPAISDCLIFPEDNIWNTRVDHMPVDPNSDVYIETIGTDNRLKGDFGSGLWQGNPIGIPYNLVTNATPLSSVIFDYDDESDPGPYPIPNNPLIEGGSDRHILMLNTETCILYELFAAEKIGSQWYAGSGAIYHLSSHDLRPAGWTSADAAGLPILPGLVRYAEVASGQINHAIRFTAPQTRRAYIWPARHYASSLTEVNYPPMGQRFRLKSDFDISTFSPEIQVILTALKQYGMILADNGSAWYMSGVPDEGWDNAMLNSELSQVPGSAFEAVNVEILRLSADSGQAFQGPWLRLFLPVTRR